MALPLLTQSPKHYPDCCLSLSTTLMETLTTVSSQLDPVISIGSGSGLFEACWASHSPDLIVEGVEVDSVTNKYLPRSSLFTVKGTWDICPRASAARVWVFVYPRDPQLIEDYLRRFGMGVVDLVIWLGPRADWALFKNAITCPGFEQPEVLEDCGLVPYELMATARRKALRSM